MFTLHPHPSPQSPQATYLGTGPGTAAPPERRRGPTQPHNMCMCGTEAMAHTRTHGRGVARRHATNTTPLLQYAYVVARDAPAIAVTPAASRHASALAPRLGYASSRPRASHALSRTCGTPAARSSPRLEQSVSTLSASVGSGGAGAIEAIEKRATRRGLRKHARRNAGIPDRVL